MSTKRDTTVIISRLASVAAVCIALALPGAEGCSKMRTNKFSIPRGAKTPYMPATEDEINEIEERLGVRLPQDYRDFLLTVGGLQSSYPILGVETYNARAKRNQLEDLQVLWTASKNADEFVYLLNRQADFEFDTRVPKRFIAIGRTFGEDQYCMSLSGPDRGHVYQWFRYDGELDEEEKKSERWLFHISNSFRTFWDRIRVSTEDDWK